MALSTTQNKAQRVSQTIDHDVDFTTEAAVTATQRLFTVFFRHLPHKDAPAQSCYQSSHFPYRGLQQSSQTCVATPHAHTSAQIACRSCSSSPIFRVIIAIVRRYGSPISRLRRTYDRHLRLCLHKHSGLATKSPECSSIDCRLGLYLS